MRSSGAPRSREAVEETLERYDAPRPVVEPAVTRFVERLLEEALLVAANGDGPAAAAPARAERRRARLVREPRLDKYTDMQELLLLDPIHEVDERGWPNSLGERQ